MRLSTQIDFEIFSNKLVQLGIELPENLIVHWTEEENEKWMKDFQAYRNSQPYDGKVKLHTVRTQLHTFKIQVD